MQTLLWKAATGCARLGMCFGKGDRSPNAAIFRSLLVVHHSRNRSSLAKWAAGQLAGIKATDTQQTNKIYTGPTW